MRESFDRFATSCARFTGRPPMLVLALLLVGAAAAAWFSNDDHLMWAASLSLSSLTVLLLPILQATQNRDGAALHAKLDELIKVDAHARDLLIGLENRTQDEIEMVRAEEEPSSQPEEPPTDFER